MTALVLAYYALLRSVLRSQPGLRRCRCRCRHCGIFFLTHPRNAGRRDLGCPFGCREAHRRRASARRSAEYYRDDQGKEKKRAQNAKRRTAPARPSAGIPAPPPPPPSPSAPPTAPSSAPVPPWPRGIVAYVRMVTSLLEGRRVALSEVVAMLLRALRQHRIGRQRRIDQTIAWLHELPP